MSKSSKGNLLGGGPRRDGAFGGKKKIRHIGWQPGDSVGCNFGSNNPGIRRDKVAFGRRLRRKASVLDTIDHSSHLPASPFSPYNTI